MVHWDQAPDGYWERLLAALPVTEVWGIAGRLAKRLEAMGIETVADLRDADPVATRHKFSVVQMRTVLELNGFPAIPLEDEVATEQQILVSRSFPDPIWDPEIVGQAVAEFAQRASHRLRKEGEVTGRITVFATTSPHRAGPTHNVSAHVRLGVPTNEPTLLMAAARAALVPKLVHRMSYMRAGFLCTDLTPEGAVPVLPGVLEQPVPIGELIDAVNRRFGTGTLALGRLGTHSPGPLGQPPSRPLPPGTPPTGTNSAPSPEHPLLCWSALELTYSPSRSRRQPSLGQGWRTMAAAHFLGPGGPPKRLARGTSRHFRVGPGSTEGGAY
ncbi:hypothetical protein [Kocuria sp. CNJ-770]|uniref:DinB/UmuC family translesion DNA polymerase n=1 Tax=Kocuria sp. CNJ-770 TaxID=1904964 RepID=UPI0013011D2F|nr:hypothetical protein [Kocuria sp. CNJ-770]